MKALVFADVGRVTLEERPEPRSLGADEALVRVTTAGICGSDIHIVEGRDRGARTGTILGHELVGIVEELGDGVTGLARGDRVVSPFTVSCGRCFFCVRSLTARCVASLCLGFVDTGSGAGLEGAQAEWVRVPLASSTLVPLPALRSDGSPLPDEDALFLGDILATAWACAEGARIADGDLVAVVGCGPVGLLAILAALRLGAREVLAADSVPYSLAKAAELGATPIDVAGGAGGRSARGAPNLISALSLAREARARSDGRGADAVLEAVGSPAALDLAIETARAGAVVSIAGYHTEERYALPIQAAYAKNLTIRIGRTSARAQIPKLLPLVLEGALPLASIVSHVLPLADGVLAYELFRTRSENAIKVLLKP